MRGTDGVVFVVVCASGSLDEEELDDCANNAARGTRLVIKRAAAAVAIREVPGSGRKRLR